MYGEKRQRKDCYARKTTICEEIPGEPLRNLLATGFHPAPECKRNNFSPFVPATMNANTSSNKHYVKNTQKFHDAVPKIYPPRCITPVMQRRGRVCDAGQTCNKWIRGLCALRGRFSTFNNVYDARRKRYVQCKSATVITIECFFEQEKQVLLWGGRYVSHNYQFFLLLSLCGYVEGE